MTPQKAILILQRMAEKRRHKLMLEAELIAEAVGTIETSRSRLRAAAPDSTPPPPMPQPDGSDQTDAVDVAAAALSEAERRTRAGLRRAVDTGHVAAPRK